jgi:hypothetical protein
MADAHHAAEGADMPLPVTCFGHTAMSPVASVIVNAAVPATDTLFPFKTTGKRTPIPRPLCGPLRISSILAHRYP